MGGPKPLAQALLQLETLRRCEPALLASGGSLVKRVRRLKDRQCHGISSIFPMVFVSVFAVVVSAGLFLVEANEQSENAFSVKDTHGIQEPDNGENVHYA